MSDYLVARPFFDLGVKYYRGETITLTDPQKISDLTTAGVITQIPSSIKSEPPVTSTIVPTS